MSAPIYRGGPPFNGSFYRFPHSVAFPILSAGAPTNGTSGTGVGVAGPGSACIDYTNKAWYYNTGTKASPTWTAFGSTAGAATPSSVACTGAVTSSSASAGFGYATGAGGTVTQATDKSTGVTLSKVTGAITMNNASLADGAVVSFVVTNTTVNANDNIMVNHVSGGTAGAYQVSANAVGSNTFSISVRNVSGGALGEAIVIQFSVWKSVAA